MNDDILVSVEMVTYNHEKYIAHALESILMQKVTFKYEILIGDDCSNDKTLEILRDYEKKYPDIIYVYHRENNLGVTKNLYDISMKCRGKYIAILEGDDFWVDEYKMQKQVDFLENNSECVAIAGRNYIVDEYENQIGISHIDENLNRYIDKNEVIEKGAALFHLCTLMHRNFYLDKDKQCEIFRDSNKYGIHSLSIFFLASIGNIYITKDIFSAWRKVIKEDGSNYMSLAHKKPLEITENTLTMYLNFRNYFVNIFDFTQTISHAYFVYTINVIRSNYNIIQKYHLIMSYYRQLNKKERNAAFAYFISKLVKHVKKCKGAV